MRIATSINWSYFSRFMTPKTKRIALIIAMVILYTVYDRIEWIHHNQMRTDNFWITWSWVIAIPAALWWLWAEYRDKVLYQAFAIIVFLFIGPVLSMSSEVRNIHIFSELERNVMLLCIIMGGCLFFLYMKNKLTD